MSADNYNLVKKIGDKWRVWLNLSASCEENKQIAGVQPIREFDECDDAVEWADEQGYTEYGTKIDQENKGGLDAELERAGAARRKIVGPRRNAAEVAIVDVMKRHDVKWTTDLVIALVDELEGELGPFDQAVEEITPPLHAFEPYDVSSKPYLSEYCKHCGKECYEHAT